MQTESVVTTIPEGCDQVALKLQPVVVGREQFMEQAGTFGYHAGYPRLA